MNRFYRQALGTEHDGINVLRNDTRRPPRRGRNRESECQSAKTRYFGLAVKWTETVSRQAYAVRPPVYSIVYDEN